MSTLKKDIRSYSAEDLAGFFKEKGEAAPKAKHGDDGQNTKSIVGEGKKTVKKMVTKPTTTKKIVKK